MSAVARHLLSLLGSLLLTPVALVMVALGAGRDFRALAMFESDVLRVPLLLFGVVLLLVVAGLAAVAWSGPVVAGLVYAAAPLAVYWASPGTLFQVTRALPGRDLSQGAIYLATQTTLGLLAAMLLGAGIAGGLGRRLGRQG